MSQYKVTATRIKYTILDKIFPHRIEGIIEASNPSEAIDIMIKQNEGRLIHKVSLNECNYSFYSRLNKRQGIKHEQ